MKQSLENFCEICNQATHWNLRKQCRTCGVYANEDTLANMQKMYEQGLFEENRE